jgi:very-short-patch-repair endonuclease
MKATQIAAALDLDRTTVNQILYGVLRGVVNQDRNYRWTLAEGQMAGGLAARPQVPTGPLAQLCRYYLDCLAQDAEQGCSVFASSNIAALDYAALSSLPDFLTGGRWTAALPETAQNLMQRARRDRSTVLYVGYPVLLRHHRTAQWEGYFVEPILLYALEAGDGGVLQIADDMPALNFKALRSLGDGGNVLDDVVALSEELGLYESEELPAFEDVARRLEAIRPDWPWIDSPILSERKVTPDLSTLEAAGLYNYAVLTVGERQNFTAGLEAELKNLVSVSAEAIKDTALGQWVSGTVPPHSLSGDSTLIDVVFLNTEQRAAVQSALSAPLTVITGPPGTGKSQVVTALLANCAWRGQRVLFASKNNKAVDVVEQRINGLASRPTLIRLGSRKYEAFLAEFLIGLLSATTAPEDQSEYDHARQSHQRLTAEAARLEETARAVIESRNEVDQLEATVEGWRPMFGQSLGHLRGIDLSVLRAAQAEMSAVAAWASMAHAGPVARLLWFALRAARLQRLNASAEKPVVAEALRTLKLDVPPPATRDVDVEAYVRLAKAADAGINGIEAIQRYLKALEHLSAQPSLEYLAVQQSALEQQLAANAESLWQSWARLQPARLSKEDRQALARFHALLQMVLDSTRAGTEIPASTRTQYREVLPKIVHLIPAWAITSLSVHGKVPFEPGFFDLLVIDEASQCDIASALPLLYRARRVAVIGDPMQLTHITKISPRQDAQLQQKSGLTAEIAQWSYSVNSLFALASTQTTGEAFVSLRDHHRSHSDIIEFSNREFYDRRLRVATRYEQLKRIEKSQPAIRWFPVQGVVRRPPAGGAVNEEEAKRVAGVLRHLVLTQNYEGTIGVVSPFRAHCNRIREIISADFALADRLGRLGFISETAHQFQGDERDLILFSTVVSQGIGDGTLGFLRKNGNLFNVAITRARAALYVVGDKVAARDSGVEYLASFVKYVDELQNQSSIRDEMAKTLELGPDYPAVARPELVSDWERILYRALYDAGIRTIPQYAVDRYVLDFALFQGDRRLNIEVDGERYHRAWDGELMRRDRLRNQRMLELGWDVMRFWVYQVRDDLKGCVKQTQRWRDTTQ